MTALVIALVGALVLAAFLFIRWRTAVRAEFIRHYPLPKGLFARLQQRRPELGAKECQLVATALRQFFLAYLHGGLSPVVERTLQVIAMLESHRDVVVVVVHHHAPYSILLGILLGPPG